jgi:hypothetical protein
MQKNIVTLTGFVLVKISGYIWGKMRWGKEKERENGRRKGGRKGREKREGERQRERKREPFSGNLKCFSQAQGNMKKRK